MPMKLVRKDDHSILVNRTAEVVYGTCTIEEVSQAFPDGPLIIEYDGSGTKLNWDSQQQLKEKGKLIYVDENDNELTEDEVELVEAGPMDEEEDDDA